MELPSIMFFTVSALSIFIKNALLAESLVVHHACEGEPFCPIKPDNYPQEEIDELVIKHLPHLHRMKRNALNPPVVTETPGTEGNCGTKTVQKMKPFTYSPDQKPHIPHLLVQSKWFEQEISKVICSHSGPTTCFGLFNQNGIHEVNFQCAAKEALANFIIYDPVSKKFNESYTTVYVDCVCVAK